jgi:hypothetical protein
MPSEVRQRSFMNRNPWLLPVLLALLIAIIVGGVLLGPKIRDAMKSATATPTPTAMPTATPRKIVVTATPGPTTPTPTPAATVTPGGPTSTPGGGPTATPNGKTGSTPLPHSTPVATRTGLQTGMITRPANIVTTIQTGADRADPKYVWYLNPLTVVQRNLSSYGFTAGFTITSPNPVAAATLTPTPHAGADGRPLVVFNVTYQGKTYLIQVVQPGTRGPKGIWQIVSILPQS